MGLKRTIYAINLHHSDTRAGEGNQTVNTTREANNRVEPVHGILPSKVEVGFPVQLTGA